MGAVMAEVSFTVRATKDITVRLSDNPLTLRQSIVRAIRHLSRRHSLKGLLKIEVQGVCVAWLGNPSAAPSNNIHPNAVLIGQRVRTYLEKRKPAALGEFVLPEGADDITERDFARRV
jgi:hypothetical protein